jgi:hypothetical protein
MITEMKRWLKPIEVIVYTLKQTGIYFGWYYSTVIGVIRDHESKAQPNNLLCPLLLSF